MSVCLSVALFVRPRLKNCTSKLYQIIRSLGLPVAVARSFSDGNGMRYVLLV